MAGMVRKRPRRRNREPATIPRYSTPPRFLHKPAAHSDGATDAGQFKKTCQAVGGE
jgi:hypothetical protein